MGQEDPLEKEITIHSDILASEIPWTKEAGALWSMGSQKSDKIWQLKKKSNAAKFDLLSEFQLFNFTF